MCSNYSCTAKQKAVHVRTLFSHVVPPDSVTTPDLGVSVWELPLCVSQLALPGLQALLQRLHLPRHLLLVLPDGHFQLAQLMYDVDVEKKDKFLKSTRIWKYLFLTLYSAKPKSNNAVRDVCVCSCTTFALCWSSPCLSFRALSMSKTSWVLSSNSFRVSLLNHTQEHTRTHECAFIDIDFFKDTNTLCNLWS